MSAPKIFTIPPGVDFTAALAEGLLADSQAHGIPLADYLVLLPTRRAARTLRQAFTARQAAMLLPRLQPLGDLDETALGFALAASGAPLTVPPAIAPLPRQMLLLRLVQQHDPALSADDAWQRAGALATLLDDMQRYQLPPDALRRIVPAELAQHWQQTLDFLQIITRVWPELLAAQGLLDPVTYHDRLVAEQIALWQRDPPAYPVIAAGSTASQPATARLLQAILALPQGKVILPGLDQHLPETIWETLGDEPTHPQHSMQQWLQHCDVPRRAVARWPYGTDAALERTQFLQQALLPAAATAQWREPQPALPADALTDIAILAAETQAEEAQIIALQLRAALAVPEQTAMLVTRDRQLAARVVGALQRWAIAIDDSAGQPLAATPPGLFLQTLLAAAAPDAGAVAFLALLKQPLAGLGLAPAACRQAARLTEIHFWRGHRRRGTPLQQLPFVAALTKITAVQRATIADLLQRLGAALAPLTAALQQRDVPLSLLLQAQLQAAEAVAATADASGAERFWCGEAGSAVAALYHELQDAAAPCRLAQGREFAALCRSWLTEATLRPAFGLHPRLSILGPLEARLQQADIVILGGMNEARWPGGGTPDPWLSRPMRQDCALPALERAVGQAAHDFVQLAARGRVLITWSRKLDGQPAAPSRFLLRCETLRAARALPETMFAATTPWQSWAQALDAAPVPQPMLRPSPRPAAALRPKRFSVTEVGPWRCNPYGFYAKHVLCLRPLDTLDPELSRADFGNLVHGVLETVMAACQTAWPGEAALLQQLLTAGEQALQAYRDEPLLYATWSAQWTMLARWLAATEAVAQGIRRPLALEQQGIWQWTLDDTTYAIVGRADRIDHAATGLTVIDYKTGHVPTDAQVKAGIEPQLPLLGAMLQRGVFADLPRAPVQELLYYRIAGRNGGQELKPLKEPSTLIAAAEEQLAVMLRRYADPATPYLVEPQPEFVPRFDDYRHLGRIEEWGLLAEAEVE